MCYKRNYFSSPAYVDLSITNGCNLKCLYCYAEAGPNNNVYMSYRTIEKFINEAENIGISYVRLAGGEPLLHPEINRILELVGHAKILSSMSTNAVTIDDNMARIIKKSGIDWVVVSLDGHNEIVHNATRGKFEKTVTGIRCLLNENVKTRLACVVTKNNYMYIPDIIEFAMNLGVASIGFILFSQVGRAIENFHSLSLNYDAMKFTVEFINDYKKAGKDSVLKVNLVFPHESMIPWELSSFILREDILKYWIADKKILQRSLGCQAGITTCAIAADGNVFGCEQLMNFPEMVSGNINDESFEKIWREGSAFRILRSVNIEDLDGECANCGNLGCGGGCRAVAYGHSHNICASYKLCKEFQK